jgi:hypothetical protein
MAELASIVLKHVRRLCVARALLNIATAIVMGSATWAASPRTATGITATAATVLRIVLRVLVAIMTGATVNATQVVLTRSAAGITATAPVVLKLVRRLRVVRALLNIATAMVMGIATAAASTKGVTGMTEIAAIFLKVVR